MTTELIGKTLRGYELVGRIGAGGFGEVYRARQQVVGREVAMKVILPQFANSPEFVRRFEAEAQFIARLEHPHIVPLFDYWREPAGAYLVMRYVSGGSLSGVLKERVLLLEETARLLDEITAALSVAHRSGVVHLDLKPDNILMDSDGNSYLTDFGIAKTIEGMNGDTRRNQQEQDDEEAISSKVSGTVSYASPEQLQSQPPTPQSDIYSLGIILYQVLAGKHPFSGKNVTGMIMAHLTESLPSVSEARPELPLLFDDIIGKATAKNPDQRYQDVRELALAFRSALEKQDATVTAEMLAALKDIDNPYKGLRPFEETDAQNFFGRDATLEQLISHLQTSNFLAVVGPSGSGKSSLVKAGLLPAIRKGAVPGSDRWFIAEMVPGATPLQNLATGLNSIAIRSQTQIQDRLRESPEALSKIVHDLLVDETGVALLVIDQFEEIFTQTEDEAQRQHFLNMLQHALSQAGSRLRVVITLRADFYDRPLQYEGFGTLIQQNTRVVLPLSTTELEAAIVGPAEQVGMQVDADLIATIIADVREEPGALPLLQYALTEVFERREGNRLTLDAYQSSGGVSGALAKRAQEVYDSLGAKQQKIARQIFLRLVTLGEGEEDTRRRARYSELVSLAGQQHVQELLDVFGKYRLITFDTDPDTREPLVEVAHEALIRSWKRLQDWLYESRGDIRQQRSLNQAAQDWRNSGKDSSFLLRGTRLTQVEEWTEETDLTLTENEYQYLEASSAERERLVKIEQERQAREDALEERARQRLRLLVTVLTVASVIGIGLTFFAFNRSIAEGEARATSEFNANVANTQVAIAATAEQSAIVEREIAELEAARAQSLALSSAAQLSQLDGERDTAVVLALEANRVPNPPPQSRLVLAQIAYSPGTLRRLELESPVDAVAMDMEGTRIVTASRNGLLAMWDVQTGEMLQQFEGHTDRVTSVVLSIDGQRLLSGSWDDTAILWETRTGRPLVTFDAHEDNVLSVALSGQIAATASSDGNARLWNIRTGELRQVISGHAGPISAIAISPDETTLLTGGVDETVRLWNLRRGTTLGTFEGHTGRINAVDYNPDGTRYLSASDDGSIRLHGANFFVTTVVLRGHEDRVLDANFSQDGEAVYSASRDGTMIVWDTTLAEAVQVFEEHDDAILSVATSTDGRLAVTGSQDETVRVWVVNPSDPERNVNIEKSPSPTLAFSPDGSRWAYGAPGQGISLYAAAGAYNQQVRSIGSPFEEVTSLAFNEAGTQIASGLRSSDIELYRVTDGERIRRLVGGHAAEVTDVAFTLDGTRLISGSLDTTVMVWDIETGVQIYRFEGGHEDSVLSVVASPQGNTIASASNDGSIVVWDLETGRERLRMLGVRESTYDLAYSPDGAFIFSAMDDGTVRQWDAATGREVNRFIGHRGPVRALALNTEGSVMLTGSEDNSMILWDVASTTLINRFETEQSVVDLATHPTEPLTLTGQADGDIDLWRVFSLDTIETWVLNNRYVTELSCEQRAQYSLDVGGC